MGELKHMYYRGYAKGCNYRCSYCPFPKKEMTVRQVVYDKQALARFVSSIEKLEQELTIMFTPYGEALIAPYYHQSMAYLTTLPHVKAVGAQTNLSFSIEDFLEELVAQGGKASKIRLWCSYHPEMVSEERFLDQCHKLQEAGISFCVGGVATPQNRELLKSMRKKLPPSLYMWLNKEDGLRRDYTQEEYQAFSEIDPLFSLQFEKRSKRTGRCTAGSESIFVEYNGDYSACHISREKLGNIYENEEPKEWGCKSSHCRCYLAYVNQFTRREERVFGEEKYFRIPDKGRIKAFFFDLDGTLLSQEGKLTEDTVEALEILAKTKALYLATSRPYESAMKKTKAIAHLLSGGIFANGAYCYDKQTKWLHLTPINPKAIEQFQDSQAIKVKKYKHQETIYKVTLQGKRETLKEVEQQAIPLHTAYEKNILSLTAKECHKGYGLQCLLQHLDYATDEVVVVGNSVNDLPMMNLVEQAICVPTGEEQVKNKATWILPIKTLPMLYASIK